MFTVLNMLIGVLCEVVAQVSKQSKTEIQIDKVRKLLLELLEEIDHSNDRCISRREFELFCTAADSRMSLEALDVDFEEFQKITRLQFEPDEPGDDDKELS